MAKKLSYKELFSNLDGLTLRSMMQTDEGWVVQADGSSSAVCPSCGVASHSRHSRYRRQLKDLPLQATAVTIQLRLGRWRCRNRECGRQIFTERVAGVLAPYARQTSRLGETRTLVGRALGGRPGQRLLSRLGMKVSRHTLIRQVKTAARCSAAPHAIRVVGVDDWAWTKGKTFGTILVDLEHSQVADLLPTRSADALSQWLAQHPDVTVVSRDRQGVYAEGARRGAPEAVQVADRFHLMLNLTQAVERELAVQRRHLRISSSTPALPPSPTVEATKTRQMRVRSSVLAQAMEGCRQARQEKLELFQRIQQMKAAGLKVSQIARQLGINRRRIDKWVQLAELPERSRMQPRPGMAESFRDYLRQRWEAGCRHGRTLFAEIRELGYVGGFSSLAQLLSPWRQPPKEAMPVLPEARHADETTSPAARQISPQVAAALLSKLRADLTPQQEEIVDTLKQQCPSFAVMRELVSGFRTILRVGKVATLYGWMERARKTGIPALERFVRTLKQDLSAVEAAVTTPWSNGPVEGHINRLKMLKRQMYGRAGVELLRARLLPESVFSGQCLHQT